MGGGVLSMGKAGVEGLRISVPQYNMLSGPERFVWMGGWVSWEGGGVSASEVVVAVGVDDRVTGSDKRSHSW